MLEHKETPRTPISDLGEFGLIDHLTERIELVHESSLKGIGDDAAVIERKPGFVEVVTTDMLVEGVHFDLGYIALKAI